MDILTYSKLEEYMLSYMNDGAHDGQHVYRVLFFALDIAQSYEIDLDVLIASALLHDIGRDSQYENNKIDHAVVGSKIAYEFIKKLGWNDEKANHIRKCISTHRYRRSNEPESMEAKILFDADKLDATGTMGIARTLAYKGIVAEPLYSIDQNGRVLDGSKEKTPSFFHEYHFKLKKLYNNFYTERAMEIARSRETIGKKIYETMLREVTETYEIGQQILKEVIEK